jgi:xylulokinase
LGIVSDVLAIDGYVSEAADASLGAAMLAGVGVGLLASLEEAVERCYHVHGHLGHSRSDAAAYDEVYGRYLATRPATGAGS